MCLSIKASTSKPKGSDSTSRQGLGGTESTEDVQLVLGLARRKALCHLAEREAYLKFFHSGAPEFVGSVLGDPKKTGATVGNRFLGNFCRGPSSLADLNQTWLEAEEREAWDETELRPEDVRRHGLRSLRASSAMVMLQRASKPARCTWTPDDVHTDPQKNGAPRRAPRRAGLCTYSTPQTASGRQQREEPLKQYCAKLQGKRSKLLACREEVRQGHAAFAEHCARSSLRLRQIPFGLQTATARGGVPAMPASA